MDESPPVDVSPPALVSLPAPVKKTAVHRSRILNLACISLLAFVVAAVAMIVGITLVDVAQFAVGITVAMLALLAGALLGHQRFLPYLFALFVSIVLVFQHGVGPIGTYAFDVGLRRTLRMPRMWQR